MNFSIDNGLSRCTAAAVMAALLLCCSWPASAGVDDVWAASPATQDTQWAQANSAPVNPSNSGQGEAPAMMLCVSCGGDWPIYAGSAQRKGDFGVWDMLGNNCTQPFKQYQSPTLLPQMCTRLVR